MVLICFEPSFRREVRGFRQWLAGRYGGAPRRNPIFVIFFCFSVYGFFLCFSVPEKENNNEKHKILGLETTDYLVVDPVVFRSFEPFVFVLDFGLWWLTVLKQWVCWLWIQATGTVMVEGFETVVYSFDKLCVGLCDGSKTMLCARHV